MFVVMPCWILAMVAGLCWTRGAVAVLTGATMTAALVLHATHLTQPWSWLQLAALGVTPWLLTEQRTRYKQRVKRAQAAEAVELNALREEERKLLDLQAESQQVDAQVAQITALYNVTKATAHALQVEELFTCSLEVLPRLLDVQGLRLIELPSPSPDRSRVEREQSAAPVVFRARRAPDGRLLKEPAAGVLPIEERLLQRINVASQNLFTEETAGMTGVPLWSEQEPIGMLVAEQLPSAQRETFSIVARQLSLQLARVQFYRTVESLAMTDTLTGVSVRRYVVELAADELRRANRHHVPSTLLMVDLDTFKSKNDTYGHLVGDVVLREVAQLLRSHLRGIDLIGRYGGEEFVLLLVETGSEQAAAIAQRLRQLVEAHAIRAYDEVLTQTISIGLASFPEDGQTLEELVERADQALYAAKRAGRNRVVKWFKEKGDEGVEG